MMKLNQLLSTDYCLKCRGCCRFFSTSWGPQLLAEEKQGKSVQKINLLKQGSGIFLCEYLKEESNECGIYVNRPFECALYPFLLVSRGNTIDLVAHIACPYVKNKFDTNEFKQYAQDLLKNLKTQKMLQLISKNKVVFYPYPEVELYMIERDMLNLEK